MHSIAKRIKAFGFDISIETPKGSHRHWKDPHSGESGSTKMLYDYGYIRRTEGTDGDHVDVYVGPNAQSDRVFIIDQLKKPDFKQFDEQKVMLGFNDADAAKAAYLKHYNDPRFFGSMREMTLDTFRDKVLAKETLGKKVAADSNQRWTPDPQVAKDVKHSVESFLVSKGLPKDTPYALLAGASMYFHGLRPELKDADIVVQGLGKQKFNEVHGKYEVDGGGNIDDLGHGLTDYTLRTRHQDHGVQFASLPATLAFKKALNRDKDRADIVAIEQHINGTNMPFKSKAQARAALGGHIPGFSKEKAEEWAHKTKNMKKLPEHVSDKKSKKQAQQSVLSDHNDPPGYMMVQNLNQLADQAGELSGAVSVEDNAEPWVESKIDRAAQAIDAVHDYMKYKSQMPKDLKMASWAYAAKVAGSESALTRLGLSKLAIDLASLIKRPATTEEALAHLKNLMAAPVNVVRPAQVPTVTPGMLEVLNTPLVRRAIP